MKMAETFIQAARSDCRELTARTTRTGLLLTRPGLLILRARMKKIPRKFSVTLETGMFNI